jgi:hypothetical protein
VEDDDKMSEMTKENFVDARRVGRFRIPEEMIRKYPHAVLDFLKKVLIVRAEDIFTYRGMDYLAYSPDFPAQQAGTIPNYYGIKFTIHQIPKLDSHGSFYGFGSKLVGMVFDYTTQENSNEFIKMTEEEIESARNHYRKSLGTEITRTQGN